jgi:hypothetical protein
MKSAEGPLSFALQESFMRPVILSLVAAVLAACGPGEVKIETSEGSTVAAADLGGKGGGYTLNVMDDGAGGKTYLVIGPDGRQVAGQADAKGEARLVEGGDAHAAISDAASAMGPPPDEKVAIKVPGANISIKANEGEDRRAKVQINVGGQSIQVDAEGPDGSERAVVKVGGADEDAARNFIDKASGLTPEVKSQMKAKLGL